jgi:hypothetical protein
MSGRTEENHENLRSGWPVSGSRIEPGTPPNTEQERYPFDYDIRFILLKSVTKFKIKYRRITKIIVTIGSHEGLHSRRPSTVLPWQRLHYYPIEPKIPQKQ